MSPPSPDTGAPNPSPDGPGNPQDQPRPPGTPAIDPQALPEALRDELQAADPAPLDMAAPELRDGVNRCPQCGSTEVRQRAGTDRLVCLFCRHEWASQRVQEAFGLGDGIDALQGTQIATGARDIEADAQHLRTYRCAGCGAEVVVNTETAMTARCHWCRHVLGVNEQIANGAVPDAVLPFHIGRDDAVERIRQFTAKRWRFALKDFKAAFKPENVVGVYLPYMVVDARGQAEVQGAGEVQTRRYTRRQGKNEETYYDADVWRIQRHIDFTVDDLTLESNAHRANLDTRVNTHNVINTILPFDTQNAVQWNASYLVGHTSEKRDQNVQHLVPRLNEQMLSIARSRLSATTQRYDRGVRWERERIALQGTRWVAMLLPVWLYSYQQPGAGGGLLHYIAVNGRTGETMGSVPVQRWKLLLVSLAVGTVVEALALWIVSR